MGLEQQLQFEDWHVLLRRKKKKKSFTLKEPSVACQAAQYYSPFLPTPRITKQLLPHTPSPHLLSLFPTDFLSALFEIVHLGYLEHLIICAEKSNTVAVSCMTCTACVTVTVIINTRRSRSTPQVGMSDSAGYKL